MRPSRELVEQCSSATSPYPFTDKFSPLRSAESTQMLQIAKATLQKLDGIVGEGSIDRTTKVMERIRWPFKRDEALK